MVQLRGSNTRWHTWFASTTPLDHWFLTERNSHGFSLYANGCPQHDSQTSDEQIQPKRKAYFTVESKSVFRPAYWPSAVWHYYVHVNHVAVLETRQPRCRT